MDNRSVRIPAISCDHCARTLREELMDIEGVAYVEIDVPAKTVKLGWQPPAIWPAIAARLREINYPPEE